MRNLERKTKEMEKSRKALIKKGQAFAKAELSAIQARNKLTYRKVTNETESDDSDMVFPNTPRSHGTRDNVLPPQPGRK